MDINEMIGYKLTCTVSKGLKDEPDYYENEFELVISKNSNEESGYKAITTAYDEEEKENVAKDWEVETVFNHLLFGNWVVQRKEKI